MSDLASIARQLGGDVVGQQILCPGPGHSRKDRSLSVRLSPTSPDGFVVHSHAGDDPLAAKDHVRASLGWDRPAWRRDRPAARPVALEPTAGADDATKIARAVAIWDGSENPRGSIVERYLSSRGIELSAEAADAAIRFHAACPWRDEVSGRTIRVPAMVAAMRSIANEEIAGVHRTRLMPDGRKVDRRMLGKAAGSAIMLTPKSAVGACLAIGEGIETCLAGAKMGWTSVWAMGSAGGIASLPLIDGLQTLHIFGELDDGGANERATEAVGARYVNAGRKVFIVTPRRGGDLNDAIRGAV